jgi:hypothetical protein
MPRAAWQSGTTMVAFAQNLLLSLAIGAEVFAIASLWPLSEWASGKRHRAGFAAALAVTIACLALDSHALAFARSRPDPLHAASVVGALEWLMLPLFLAFPAAVCVASAQSLTYAGVPAKAARGVALLVAVLAVIVAPFAALTAGCGLAGACF